MPKTTAVVQPKSPMDFWRNVAVFMTIVSVVGGVSWKILAFYSDRQLAEKDDLIQQLQKQVSKLQHAQRISFVEEEATGESGPGWQNVTVAVEPEPSPEEKVHVWLKQGDSKWYHCEPARRLGNTSNWKAKCRFGNPASTKDADKAKPGQNWFSYGVFCFKDIGGAVLPDALPDDAFTWQGHVVKETKSYPTILPATYKGKER